MRTVYEYCGRNSTIFYRRYALRWERTYATHWGFIARATKADRSYVYFVAHRFGDPDKFTAGICLGKKEVADQICEWDNNTDVF